MRASRGTTLLSSRCFPQSFDSQGAQHPTDSLIAAFYLADFQLEPPSPSAQLQKQYRAAVLRVGRAKCTVIVLIINGVAVAGGQLPVN